VAISATEMKNGQAILVDGEIHIVVGRQHTKPGKGGTFIQAKLKKLSTGQVLDRRFRSADKVETAFLEKKEMQYSYTAEGKHFFLDPETFDQVPIDANLIGDAIGYLKSGTPCQVMYHEGKAVTVDLPNTVDLEVKETSPVIKGATATNQYKPATLETGVKVSVPPFIERGETIRIDTRTGEYVERAK
jgi:elongation factor P